MTVTGIENAHTTEANAAPPAALAPVRWLRAAARRAPLSGRAVAILLGATYLVMGPAVGSSDIIAAGLASGALVLISILTLMVAVHGRILERTLAVTTLPPADPLIAGSPARVVLHLTPLRILPLTYLDIRVQFAHPLPTPTALRVRGARRRERREVIELTFPHRGSWEIRGVECTLRDLAGLVRHRWSYEQESGVTVTPPTVSDTNLRIISSTQRPGDLLVDLNNRQGDPFDIKAYHPADGIKKIVWKAFAKRGELLSRHPEASMTPEGFVVVLVLAGQRDDNLCAHALAYLRSLAELKLDVSCGCQGGHGQPAAATPAQAESLLIDSVWEAAAPTLASLRADTTALLDHCRAVAPGIQIARMVIFCPPARLHTSTDSAMITQLCEWIATQGITPVLCMPRDLHPSTDGAALQHTSRLAQWFTTPPQPHSTLTTTGSIRADAQLYAQFLTTCMQRQWEVLT
jgi:hypothetical protein